MNIIRIVSAMVLVIGLSGCANSSEFSKLLEDLNKSLNSIAILKKGAD